MAEVGRRKAYAKLIQNIINTVVDDETKPTTLAEVQHLLKELENHWIKLQEVHFKILDVCADDNARIVQDDIFVEIHTSYMKGARLLQSLKSKITEPTTTNPPNTKTQLKLPEFHLPKFNGKPEEWPAFHDLFIGAIDNHTSLTAAQKLHYLKTCLEGDAAALIKSFTLTDGNHTEAWRLLKERYNNKREIIYSLIKKLLFQQQIKVESAANLQLLLDTTNECLRCLSVWGQPTDSWDSIIIVLLTDKLDPSTKAEWAKGLDGTELIEIDKFTSFLKKQIRALSSLDTVGCRGGNKPKESSQGYKGHKSSHHVSSNQANTTCSLCKEEHQLRMCPQLRSIPSSERMTAIRKTRACINCLREGHTAANCTSGNCKHCGGRHHSYLHPFTPNQRDKGHNSSHRTNDSRTNQSRSNINYTTVSNCGTSDSSQPNQIIISNHTCQAKPTDTEGVLLKTALVYTTGPTGNQLNSRVLLDDGSEASFMRESCARALGLVRSRTDIVVSSVGSRETAHVKWKVLVRLTSRYTKAFVDVEALLLPKVTGMLPPTTIFNSKYHHIEKLELADPEYYKSREVDILLGADVLPEVLLSGLRVGPPHTPAAQQTIFGWTLFGKVNTNKIITSHHVSTSMEEIMQRFWEVEKVPTGKPLTIEERKCEEHFKATHRRLSDGRFMVRLPFNEKREEVGETRELATRRLIQLERRFTRNPHYRQAYTEFMAEYLKLGHMKPAPTIASTAVYIPHHFVVKEDSTKTKLRVVFDASMKSSTNTSLNDTLMAGPTVQPELFSLIIRFRLFKVALKADVAKMYRQFAIHPDDQNYQRILWRDNPTEPIKEFNLTTVTYGTACAPFLATRCLIQLAEDEVKNYPKASKQVRENMYVDDLMGGADSTEEAINLRRELSHLCETAQLSIRKWCSNDINVMNSIPPELHETGISFNFENEENIKALGVRWQPAGDYFFFNLTTQRDSKTKREVLSDIASTFDPLGWITPVTITAKIIMQGIGKRNISWDSPIPEPDLAVWKKYLYNLQQISSIRIPRFILPGDRTALQLHGFSDASEKAYSAAVYIRSVTPSNAINTFLVASKTKVAPLDQKSLPRLELCGAHLLAELMNSVRAEFPETTTLHAWTNSMIVLHWLTKPSKNWKTYVANRVATIQKLLPPQHWNHVSGKENPADLPSRGISPEDLQNSELWWHGPAWLSSHTYPNSSGPVDMEQVKIEENKTANAFITSVKQDIILSKLCCISSYRKIVTSVAVLIKFARFLYTKSASPVTVTEESQALLLIIKLIQRESFPHELESLSKQGSQVQKQNRLRSLNPFLDDTGIMRVGGRLKYTKVTSIDRHPIILPGGHSFTKLLINHYHLNLCHGGFQLTLASIRRKYWIVGGRVSVRTTIQKCVPCRKTISKCLEQQMGSLPSVRVTPNRPFLHTGVDFAGPFSVRMKAGRGIKTFKCYMAVFVCFTTKAVHLEAVTSLSTDAFMASFRRFSARRGVPSHMYSDCGTNFIGASREINKLLEENNIKIQQKTRLDGTTWVFNPPASPHRGGWEAAVKSAKLHMQRVIGQESLTYEQFSTLLCNIEACMNSRPLCALSCDPEDIDALTPAHFLIGESLKTLPEVDVELEKCSRVDHFRRIQAMTQSFWKRWTEEYLTTLQQRPKWQFPRRNIDIGDLVAIKDENLGPTKWKLGRTISVIKGADGLIRQAVIKTQAGELTRPIQKLSPILFQNEAQ